MDGQVTAQQAETLRKAQFPCVAAVRQVLMDSSSYESLALSKKEFQPCCA